MHRHTNAHPSFLEVTKDADYSDRYEEEDIRDVFGVFEHGRNTVTVSED